MPVQKKPILTVTATGVLFLLVLLAVSACAAPGGIDKDPQLEEAVEAVNIATDESTELSEKQPEPMSADEMYRVIAAELEGSEGEVRAALSSYLEAALLSDDPEVAKRATLLSIRARSWQHAAMAADRWQVLDPGNLDATRALATAHISTGNYKAAAYQLDMLYKNTEGTETEKWQQVTAVLARSSSNENARDLLQQLIDKHQLNGDTRAVAMGKLAQSQLAAKLGDMTLAIQLGKEAAAGLVDDVPTQLWVGRLLIASGRLPDSTEYFKRAWAIDPSVEESAMAYAEILHRQKNTVSANKVLADLVQTDKVILNRLVFATLEKDPQRAEQLYYKMADSVDKDTSGHAIRMARAADLLMLIDEARHWYEQVPETDAAWVAARLRLSVLLTVSEGLDNGRAILEPLKNAEQAAVVEQAWLADSQLLQQAQKLPAATESLKRGLIRLPDSVPLNYSLGLLLAQSGDVDAAEVAFRKVLNLQPNNPAALNALGYTLTDQTDRHSEALGYIQRALELQPDDVSAIDSMGWVLFRLGRNVESLKYLKRAYQLDKNPEIVAHLVEVLWESGLQAEAKQVFYKARASGADDPVLLETGERLGL
ncbi:MAG: tetratricopeptide repeat protein [Proteobacteria bacterium]|nr:tetratricopeptide repeat protein [Pseudomonadota bacterium]